jgi:hypothetical protein
MIEAGRGRRQHEAYSRAIEEGEAGRRCKQKRQAEHVAVEGGRAVDVVNPHRDLMQAGKSGGGCHVFTPDGVRGGRRRSEK